MGRRDRGGAGESPERWSRLQDVFEVAAALAPPQRMVFLARCRQDDPVLADEVDALVRSGREAGTFIEEMIARALRK